MNNEKTSLGVSVSVLGAAMYFTVLLGGYIPFLLLAGYVFLRENDEWLKKTAVKAFAVYTCFQLAYEAVNLIPSAISVVDDITGLAGRSFSIPFVSNLVSLVKSAIYFMRPVMLLLMGFQAFKKLDVAFPFVDKIADFGTEAAVKAASAVKKEEPKEEPKTEPADSKAAAEATEEK